MNKWNMLLFILHPFPAVTQVLASSLQKYLLSSVINMNKTNGLCIALAVSFLNVAWSNSWTRARGKGWPLLVWNKSHKAVVRFSTFAKRRGRISEWIAVLKPPLCQTKPAGAFFCNHSGSNIVKCLCACFSLLLNSLNPLIYHCYYCIWSDLEKKKNPFTQRTCCRIKKQNISDNLLHHTAATVNRKSWSFLICL